MYSFLKAFTLLFLSFSAMFCLYKISVYLLCLGAL